MKVLRCFVCLICDLSFVCVLFGNCCMGGSSSNMANPVVISATAKHTATLIFFHGLGDTGHGWASTIAQVRSPHIKVVCPTAPTMPVTLNMGFQMPSWFDLMSLDASGPEDAEGIRKAIASVHTMIENEIKAGIPSNRILLGGFSQGGALALSSALQFNQTLAGIIGLSCWLPLHKNYPQAAIGNRDIPVFQCHGNADPVVPFVWGQLSNSFLQSFMSNLQFKTYQNMGHSSCDEELRDVKKFIEEVLPPV